MKKIYAALFLLLSGGVFGQDIHFSQIYNTPALLNPGLVGSFEGSIRAIANWKDQWQGIRTDLPGYEGKGAYRTFGFSFDHKVIGNETTDKWYFAYGVSAYADFAGDASLGTINAYGTVASGFKFGRFHDVGLGVTGGWGMTTVDEAALRFPSMVDGPGSLPGGLNFDNRNWGDISSGLTYRYYNATGKNVKVIRAGVAVHHLNQPAYNFSADGKLAMRMVAHWSGYFGLKSNKYGLWPSISYQYQSPHSETMVGMLFKMFMGQNNNFALAFGVHSRMSFHSLADDIAAGAGNVFSDAIIPELVVEFSGVSVGLNYDVNISTLNEASNGRGGFELSLKYIMKPKGSTVIVQI